MTRLGLTLRAHLSYTQEDDTAEIPGLHSPHIRDKNVQAWRSSAVVSLGLAGYRHLGGLDFSSLIFKSVV